MLFLQASFALAQTSQNDTPTAAKSDQVTLNFQNVDIRALITTVSEITGRNFIVDPRVRGQVTVVSGGPLDADQIYDVFLAVLEVHNFAAVPFGDVTKIVPTNIIKQEPTPVNFGPTEKVGAQQITQVYKLQYASVQDLVPVLRPLLPPTSHFAVYAPSNTVVFTDTRANVHRILEIIARLDVPDRRTNVRVIFLQHAQATALAPILSQLAASFPTPGGQAQAPSQVSVLANEGTNALIISAPDREYRMLQAVVDQLDVEREVQQDIHVMYLKYAKAADLVDILNQVSAGLIEAGGTNNQPSAREITVQAAEGANALVVRAGPKDFKTIQAVVKQLDVKRKQVFVEAIIAEVSYEKSANLGIEWQTTDTDVSAEGQLNASTDFSDIAGGLALGFINDFIVDATGAVVPDLEIILRALRSDSHTNILSTPNLLTLDNEEAEIVVGQEVPFVTGEFTTPVSEDGADNDGVVTPFQTIERRDVGLTLKVTPQINAGNTMILDIEQEISSVSDATIQGASDLITNQRRISATVQVESGQIVVIGGLIRDDTVESVERVPLLGRLPIIGALFRHKKQKAVKTNLMVFLRPLIVGDDANLVKATRKKYQYMRELSRRSRAGGGDLILRHAPAVLPEVKNWAHPTVDLEPEIEPTGSKVEPRSNVSGNSWNVPPELER